MSRRSTRSDASVDHSRLLSAVSDCHSALIEASTKAQPNGPLYNACAMVVAAIDALTTFLTGNPYFHHASGHSQLASRGPEGERKDGS